MSRSKRRGRPALEAGKASAQVTIRVPASDYDRVFALSSRTRETVPDVLRRALRRLLSDERGGSF